MKKILSLFIILSIIACSNDETSNEIETSNNTLTESLNILTDGNTKTWVIEEAILTNANLDTSIDITSSLNVTDDRFIFSMDGEVASVEWKQREAINWQASSVEEIFRDFYASNETFELIIAEDNASIFTAFDGTQDFTIVDDSTITGIIEPESGVEFQINLRPLTDNDLTSIPTSLDFTEVASFVLDGDRTIGCTSSALTNTIYFSERVNFSNDDGGCITNNLGRGESIYTYNVSTGVFEKNIFCQPSQFVTKELEIIDGNLVSLSSSSVNTYSLDNIDDPDVSEFGDLDQFTFTRQGTATRGSDIYFTGSNFSNDQLSDRILKFNTLINSLDIVTHMPTTKYFADAEIVDDKLYVFGGAPVFSGGFLIREDHIYIYDFTSDSWSTEFLPEPINDTFTARYQDLIYIGGSSFLDTNDDGNGDDFIEHFFVYDTTTGEVTEIPYTLNSTFYTKFQQITILGDKIYLLTGPGPDNVYKLFEANLN